MRDSLIKPGTVVADRFSVLNEVSRGTAATVFRAADLSNAGSPVALKVVTGEQSSDVLEEFFGREVESLRRLRHPNVVRLFDAGTDPNIGRWLALEWLERGTFADGAWRQIHREPSRLVELLKDLLGALAAAHRQGIIHRDIKPSNILFDSGGVPRLADFNVSKLLGRTRSTQTVRHFFTVRWAAPEQKSGKPADERSDVYALGLIAAEVFTNYDGDEVTDLLQLLEKPVGPGPLRHLLRCMLSANLVDRPTASEALQDANAIIRSIGPETRVPLRLTRSVVETLSTLQGGATTPKDIFDLVRVDLGGRLTVQLDTRPASYGGTTYTLLGKRYSYRAAAPEDLGAAADELSLVSAIRLPPRQQEQQRTSCVVLPVIADIIPSGATPIRGKGVREFVTTFAELKTLRDARREEDYISEAQLDAWESYLELSRALKSERARIGTVRRSSDRDEEGLIECELEQLFVSPDDLSDAWVSYIAPGGQIMRVGLVVDASSTRILIRPHDDLEDDVALPPGGQLVRDARQEEASLQRQAAAVRMVRQHADAEGDLLGLLARPDRANRAHRIPVEPRTKNLDANNREVVELALGTDRLFLVQGPPGTGKTTVIAELITQILQRETESRILLVSQSNVAIDNVLERLQTLLPSVPAVRLGRAEKIGATTRHLMLHDRLAAEAQRLRVRASAAHDRLTRLGVRDVEELDWLRDELSAASMRTGDRQTARELAEDVVGPGTNVSDEALVRRINAAKWLQARGESDLADLVQLQAQWGERVKASEELEELMLQSIRVVAGTCVGVVASRAIGDSRFEWVIVDEAGRASPPELLVPLVRGRRLVLLGDHRQLPPILDDEVTQQVVERLAIPKDKLQRSLFEELFEAAPEGARSRLRRQYRMHPEIGGLVEHVFYPEGLEHAVSVEERPMGSKLWGAALRWLDTGALPHASERRVASSFLNAAEVRVLVAELEMLEKGLVEVGSPVSVGLLTAYSSQRQALEDALSPQRRGWTRMDVSVLTVDAAQGKEYDLVYYSAVRSNPSGRIGFLRDERRLNVALSRAKHGLTIVGDLHALVVAGTRFGSNPFVGVQGWFAKSSLTRPIIRVSQ